MEILNNISEAERGGLLDLGKALRHLMLFGGEGEGGGAGQGAASFAEVRAGVSVDKFISPASFFEAHAAYTLTDTALIPVNMDYGINFLLTISDDRSIADPINVKLGQEGIFLIQQNAAGGHNLTWGDSYKFPTGTPPSLPQAPHAWTLIRYFVQSPSVIRCTVESSSANSLNAATVQEVWLGLESLRYLNPAVLLEAEIPVPLVDEDPVFIDLGEGKNFTLTITADREIDSPLDQLPGRWGKIKIFQDNVGGHDLTWHSHWKPAGGIAPTIRSGAGASTTFEYRVLSIGVVELIKEPEAATMADVWKGSAQDKYLSPHSIFEAMVDVELVDGATIVPDLDEGLTFSLTLGASRQISNPTGQRAGKAGRFFIQQDAQGGHELTWGTDFKFVGGIAPVIPIAPNAWTVIPYEVRSPGNILAAAVEPFSSDGSGEAVLPASTAEVRSAAAVSKYVNPSVLSGFFAPYTIPSSATPLPDMDLGVNFLITLTQNATIQNMTHQRLGNGGNFIIVQGGSGGYTLAWDTNYSFLGGTPTMPTAVGSWIMVPYTIQAFGTIRALNIQTNAIPGAATVQEVWAGAVTNKFIPPSVAVASKALVSLTDGATIALDLNAGINFTVTIAGNRAFANPTNQVAGKEGILRVKQDAIGGRSLSWGNQYVFEGDAPVLNDDPDAITVIPYHVESVGSVLLG